MILSRLQTTTRIFLRPLLRLGGGEEGRNNETHCGLHVLFCTQVSGQQSLLTPNGLWEGRCLLSHDESWPWSMRWWWMDAGHET